MHPSYRKIVDMVSKKELRIDGVEIDYGNFLPGKKVAEFFGLSDEQLAEMKKIGIERLQEKQKRELSLTKINEASDFGIVFDVPADPAFAASEATRFTEQIAQRFGPDVAAMLQPSIEAAYGDLTYPRHVRYKLTLSKNQAPANASEETRAMYEGLYDYTLSTNQNEDGSYMTDAQGLMVRGGGSSTGTFNLNDTKPEAHRPRYHYLWEREMRRK